MVKYKTNIRNIRKALVIAFASLCLSFLFTPISHACVESSTKGQKPGCESSPSALGYLSAKYESGKCIDVISSGKMGTGKNQRDDPGGPSFGKYQFAPKVGGLCTFTNFLKSNYPAVYSRLMAGGASCGGANPKPGQAANKAFENNWKAFAAADPKLFEEVQDACIQKNYLGPCASRLAKGGIDLSKRSPALQAAFLSTAVQHGPGKCTAGSSVMAGITSDMSDAEILDKLYNNRAKAFNIPFSRFEAEKKDAINWANQCSAECQADPAKCQFTPADTGVSDSYGGYGGSSIGKGTGGKYKSTSNSVKANVILPCDIKRMQERYKSSCYSCLVVKTLTQTFMEAASVVYPTTREAGSKLVIIGSLIWLVLFALKNVSSFASLEPSNNVHDLLVFFFKVVVALVFINAGVPALVYYIVEPILIAGADYGQGIISSVNGWEAPQEKFAYAGKELISAKTINKLFGLNQAIDATVSENLVIGNAIVCHSQNAGAWVDVSFMWLFSLKIPNMWLLLCGAAIWFAGFMMTLGVSYYVLDVSFKIGFAIMLLPVAIGLWPFAATKDKLPKLFSIIVKSAATFAFLAMTSSYALALITTAMRDVNVLYDKIGADYSKLSDTEKAANVRWISETFEITGPYFILIMFAYLYAIKMIGATISGYVDKIFSDDVFGSVSPIHSKATQATDIAQKKSMGIAKSAAKIGAVAGYRGAKGLVNKLKGDEKGGTTIYGNSMKGIGMLMKATGRASSSIGNFNRKVSQGLQKFGEKQLQKGADKRNVFRLAAGGMATKLAAKNIPLTNSSTKIGNRLEALGKRVENHGKNTNQYYRDVKGATKEFAKDVKDGLVEAKNEIKADIKGAAKTVQQGAARVGNKVADKTNQAATYVADKAKNTVVYKAGEAAVTTVANTAVKGGRIVSNAAKVTGNKLQRAYVVTHTGVKGAVLQSKNAIVRNANHAANKIGRKTAKLYNKTKSYIKSTKIYKAADKTGKFVGSNLTKAYLATDRTARKVAYTTKGVYKHSKQAVGNAANAVGDALVNNKVVRGAKILRQEGNDFIMGAQSSVGNTINATKSGARNIARSISSYGKGKLATAYNWGARGINRAARAGHDKLYNAYGEKLENKYGITSSSTPTPAPAPSPKPAPRPAPEPNGSPEPTNTRDRIAKLRDAVVTGSGYSFATEQDGSLNLTARNIVNYKELSDADKILFSQSSTLNPDGSVNIVETEMNFLLAKSVEARRIIENNDKFYEDKENNSFINYDFRVSKYSTSVPTDEEVLKNAQESAKRNLQDWSEKEREAWIRSEVETVRRAKELGLCNTIVEGEGYTFATDVSGLRKNMSDLDVNNRVDETKLSGEDKSLYRLCTQYDKDGNIDVNATKNEFLNKKSLDMLRNKDNK